MILSVYVCICVYNVYLYVYDIAFSEMLICNNICVITDTFIVLQIARNNRGRLPILKYRHLNVRFGENQFFDVFDFNHHYFTGCKMCSCVCVHQIETLHTVIRLKIPSSKLSIHLSSRIMTSTKTYMWTTNGVWYSLSFISISSYYL